MIGMMIIFSSRWENFRRAKCLVADKLIFTAFSINKSREGLLISLNVGIKHTVFPESDVYCKTLKSYTLLIAIKTTTLQEDADMLKKVLFSVIMATTIISTSVPAMANPLASAAVVTGEAIKTGYEESVIQRMVGRAGAKTLNGAKGIVHEIIYADKLNLRDAFKKGTKTSLTKSSTAQQVDVVTTNGGKVAARYQLKDTANSIKETLKQVKSGKYQQVQMIGTKETAKAFNERTAAEGITKAMKSSGISTKTTSRIANKALNPVPAASEIAGMAVKAAGIGAAVSGVVATAESIKRGDDFSEAAGHIAVGTTNGAISMGLGAAAGGAITAGLTSTGAVGAAPVIAPAAVMVGVGVGTGVALEKVNEKYDIEGKISQTIDSTNKKYDLEGKVSRAVRPAYENISKTSTEAIEQLQNTVENVVDEGKGVVSAAISRMSR